MTLHVREIINVDLFNYRIELGRSVDLQFTRIGRLISQSLQRQAQVTLARLSWNPKSGECAKSCSFIFSSVGEVEMPLFACCTVDATTWLRQEGCKVYETFAEGCHAEW